MAESGRDQTPEEKIAEQVARYDGPDDPERPRYVLYSKVMKAVLARACNECGVLGFVQARAKATDSFAEKIIRKGEALDDPVTQFTDLCGARVITQTLDDVDKICEFVRDHFKIDEANSPDISSRLRVGEFGYLSTHLVVQLPWATMEGYRLEGSGQATAEEQLMREVLGGADEDLTWQEVVERIGNRKAEVQVRTLLQHAWSDVTHDRVYKGDFDPPQHLQRQLHRMAALLEEADGELQEAVDGVDAFNVDYATYLEPEQIREEIRRSEIVLEHTSEKKKPELALRTARLATALEDWQKVVEALDPFAEHEDTLRELGLALSKLGRPRGRAVLKDAVEADPEDHEAFCYLGDTYCKRVDTYLGCEGEPCDCCEKACEYYARAFEIAPNEPHVLRSYLECTLCEDMDLDSVRLLRPGLETAIQTCRERADIGVYLPYGYYDIGVFNLILGRPYESLSAFAKAVHHSRTPRKVERALSGVERLQESARRQAPAESGADREELDRWLRRSEWVRRFLLLARAAKLQQYAQRREEELAAKREADNEESAPSDVENTAPAPEAPPGEETDEDAVELARETADKAVEELRAMLATSPDVRFSEPVVIVAGGTDQKFQKQMEEYGQLVMEAFAGFGGTIISGGTTAGICGLIGGLSTGAGVSKVSYLPDPNRLPPNATVHLGYDCRRPVPGDRGFDLYAPKGTVEFCALEPIQAWIDLLSAGVDPSRVSLLGINGGQIAAFEYRMALALGATVGIIQSSGRAAADMREEVEVWRPGSLLWLPADPMSLQMFVQPAWSPGDPFDKREVLDRAARVVHERYCRDKQGSGDPALKPWPDLDELYKKSNRRQVLGARRILRTEGYELRRVDEPGEPVSGFDDAEVERMAEKEHGRYVADRLRDGWQYGEERSKEARTSPYLCAWSDLPDNIREYDREAVRQWPEVMEKAGLKIVWSD